MKMRLIILGLIALPAVALAMSRGPGGLDGVYSRVHEIMVIPEDTTKKATDGDPSTMAATHQLHIRHDTGSGFDFHAELTFSYFHTCDLKGHARVVKSSTFGHDWYFRYEQPKEKVTGSRCVLDFKVTQKRIELSDPDHTCHEWCGARGYFDGVSFERTSHKAVD